VKFPVKKQATKIPAPRKHPSGAGQLPSPMQKPKLPKVKDRIYAKSVLKDDPMEFADFSFGQTGLTGES
jgi:hypothetical protein